MCDRWDKAYIVRHVLLLLILLEDGYNGLCIDIDLDDQMCMFTTTSIFYFLFEMMILTLS